nr:CDP-diacylglycerol--glycerol-3-phosphate 3-phosphatidyltransferase [Proteocatella sp.]
VEAWLVIIIITREYAISIIRAIAATNGKVIAASGGGKIKTVTQMLAIIMLLLSMPFGDIMMYVCVALTLYSGVEYIWNNRELIAER